MSSWGEDYEYEVKQIEPELLTYIKKMLSDGASLLATANSKTIGASHFAWANSFSAVVDILDPIGGDRSNSLSGRWYSAHFYNHKLAKTPYEDSIVFGQCVGVANSLLAGKVNVVKRNKKTDESSRSVFHTRNLPMQNNLVFTLMPFTEKWSDYIWKKEIKPLVEGLDEYSLICRRADDLFGKDIVQDIYESILTARIIIAEITGRNANVFYELGMAQTLGKDVVLMTQGVEHIPFDLNRFRHCIYSNDGPGYQKLRDYLKSSICELLKANLSA